jgi:hypothetical protein
VWVETLDRRPIIKRGMVEDTSIDPSDGPDQIRRLLELLRAAFDNSDPEHPNTSLTLALDDDGDSLAVHVTCVLPKPLKPFKWPMQLKKCPQSTIASELVLPMIQAHEARTREIGQLTSLLREKDAVITRIIDKLEAAGTGLEQVFNALSGKRKVTRAAAEGKVKGLAPFSEADFRAKDADLRPVTQSSDVSALLGAVFGSTGLQYKSDLELEASTVLNDWWTKLAKGRAVILSEFSEKESQPAPPPQEPEPSKDEDDFQVQATPPGVRSSRKRASPIPAADDDETSDGEDAPEPSAPSPAPKTTGKASGSRIGAIGRNKKASPSPSPPPASIPQRSTKAAAAAPTDTHSETASEVDDKSSPPPSPPKPAPKRGGLGRIGGKSKQPSPPARSPSPAAPAEETSSQLPKRHKLGMIGKQAPSPGPDASDDTRGRSKTPASQPKKEQVRETSQERADRKRAELQKEMEKRAAAGPAKKKRKF